MNRKYPFDPSYKNHFLIALGLALWIFLFLFFTEPLDVSELSFSEKLRYLPIYGLIVGFCYSAFLPLQTYLFQKNNSNWRIKHEVFFLVAFMGFTFIVARLFYLYIIVAYEPNPYTLWYYFYAIFLPALSIILPIVLVGRFGFGKYKDKKLEERKIKIQGEGHYESLRLQLKDLICIQSSGNYIEVYYRDATRLKKSLIRNKLSVIEESFPELLRTHRSFIINPFHFKSWHPEKGKHFLKLSHEVTVPISKTYLKTVKSELLFATA